MLNFPLKLLEKKVSLFLNQVQKPAEFCPWKSWGELWTQVETPALAL